MNAAGIWLATWLAEFLTGATVLLAAAILVRAMFRQPAARVAVAWSTCVGILLLAALLAWRDRPRVALVEVARRWTAAEPAVSSEPTSARYSDLSPVAALPSIVETDAAVIAEPIAMTADVETAVAVNPDNRGVISQPQLFAPWRELLIGVWLTIAAAMLLWIGLGAYRARRLLSTARGVPDWVQAELARLVGTSRPPGLWASPRVTTAVALGAAAPQIILPTGLEKSHVAAVRAALAHEWAHIRHGDLWLLALERLLVPLLAVHPLFWWLRRSVRLDQELLADAAAAGSEPAEYAEALLQWAKDAKPARHGLAALALWEHPSTLSRRVAMLLDPRRPISDRISRWHWAAAAGAILPAIVVLSALSLGPVEAQEPAAANELRATSGDSVTVEVAVDEPEAPAQSQSAQSQPVERQSAPPVPEAAKVVLTQIHMELVVMRASRAKLAEADTTLEDEIAAATDSRCQREAGLVTVQIAKDEVDALTTSLKEKNAVTVLSRPSLITFDGREAMVQMGGKHPTLWVEETINGKHEERLEYQEFGTHLLVTPKQLADKPGWLSLLVEAQQSELIRPTPYTNDGGPPANVPGIVSRKFRLNTEIEIGKSLLVAESPGKQAKGEEPKRDQFLLILKPSKVTLEASAIYLDPGAAERARATAATRLSPDDLKGGPFVFIPRFRSAPEIVDAFKEGLKSRGFPKVALSALEAPWEADKYPLGTIVCSPHGKAEAIDSYKILQQLDQPLAARWHGAQSLKSDVQLFPSPPDQKTEKQPVSARVPRFVGVQQTSANSVAEQLKEILKALKEEQITLAVDARSNSIIISGSEEQFAKVRSLIQALDRPAANASDVAPHQKPNLELRLLELDRAEAEATLRVAEAELQSNEEIHRKHPGAVSQTELRKFQGMVDRAKIQLERIKLKLEAARAEEPSTLPGLQTH